MENMPSEKKTELFPDQLVESNDNESVGTDGGMILLAESRPNEAPSAEVELHSESAHPATTGNVMDFKLSKGIDSPKTNAEFSVDVEGDKNATVVRRLDVRDHDSIENTGGNPAQDNQAEIPVDISHVEAERASNGIGLVASTGKIFVEDAHTTNNLEISNAQVRMSEIYFPNSVNERKESNFEENTAEDSNVVNMAGDVLYKESERACKVDVFAEKIIVDDTITNNSSRSHNDETSTTPIYEIDLSNPTNIVEKSPFGNAESFVCAESSEIGCTTNETIDGCGSSSFSVDGTNVETQKLGSDVRAVAKDVPCTEAGQKAGVRHSNIDESTIKGNPTDLSCKNGDSSANAGHNITFIDDIHNNIGQSSQGPASIDNIEPPDVHGVVNTVTIMNSSGANISEISGDKLPSIVPDISTAAVMDQGLESNSKQEVIQNCAERHVQEEVATEDATQNCAKHGVEGVLKQEEVQTGVEDDGGEEVVGQKVKKRFGKKNYIGQVVAFDQETLWYKVKYEDGDEEDLEWEELEAILLQPKGGKSAARKRKRSSGLRFGDHRKLKRVQRSNGPGDTKTREREPSISMRDKSRESADRKGDENKVVGHEEFLITDAADGPTAHTRTVKRCSAEVNATKRRKLEGESILELDKATCLKTRNKLIMESVSQSQSNSTEIRVSTQKNSVSSSSNIEAVSCLNANILNSNPTYHDVTKSEHHESSDKKIPAQGGGIRLIGRKTKKDFGGQIYKGEVIDFDYKANYYKVKYEDGDEEELEWSELEPTLIPSDQKPLSFKNMLRARNMAVRPKGKDHPISNKENAETFHQDLVLLEGGAKLREEQKPASVLEEVKEGLHGKEYSSGQVAVPVDLIGHTSSSPRPHAVARFSSVGDADNYEYFGWGEVVAFDRAKCPELRAAKLMPTSLPIVHLAASQHHLAAITAGGQVWLWRNRHGYIHSRCNEWEYIASLGEKGALLVDVAGPDLDRASSGYEANQEDQVPDPFYLVAVGSDGEDFILQGSQPQEIVRTYQLSDEPQYLSLKGSLLRLDQSLLESLGRIVQISVGTVEAPDESPFIGYITDTDHVYIRSATKDYMEEISLVSGYTGKPIKIQCGRVYHAIIMTDDGRAWTWGRGYYHGPTGFSAATCQPAVGTLVGRKVIDVGCYGEDFIALTNDGDVHQWTHAVPNPADGVYNVPNTPVYGRGPRIPNGDKLKQVSIGAGLCAGVTDSGRVHTWRTAMKGGLIGISVPENEALTPLGHEENQDTAIVALGNRTATKVICVAGSLIVIVKKKARGRAAGSRKMKQKTNTESGIERQS